MLPRPSRSPTAATSPAAALGDLTKHYFKWCGDVAKANNIRAE